ncbi:hypothetical protein RCH06_001418 [Polaromonas sp. CG_9.5]|nr:hypothetical protein [Polaromonas sp. CG_9.5]
MQTLCRAGYAAEAAGPYEAPNFFKIKKTQPMSERIALVPVAPRLTNRFLPGFVLMRGL